jgi:membrane protein
VGPLTLLRRVVNRLDAIGWVRAAGSLAFTTILGIVPLATVALAFVAQFPMFQDFLQVLERFLLRYMLPQSASALVNDYILGMAAEAAELKGVWILFVMVTAILVVHAIESGRGSRRGPSTA